ncbi:protease modulator HflK, partial [Burkholderia gladioli]|nr:protease modulator HflK [Burkholderia gladioli]
DADRYKQVYAQYEKAPAVVRERMYLDTMQDIYSKATKVYIGSKSGNSLVYLPIDKIVEQQRQRAAEAASGAAPAAAGQPASVPDAGNTAPASSGATAASVSAAPAASAANAASAAPGNDPLRSREAFRSRSREDDLQ